MEGGQSAQHSSLRDIRNTRHRARTTLTDWRLNLHRCDPRVRHRGAIRQGLQLLRLRRWESREQDLQWNVHVRLVPTPLPPIYARASNQCAGVGGLSQGDKAPPLHSRPSLPCQTTARRLASAEHSSCCREIWSAGLCWLASIILNALCGSLCALTVGQASVYLDAVEPLHVRRFAPKKLLRCTTFTSRFLRRSLLQPRGEDLQGAGEQWQELPPRRAERLPPQVVGHGAAS